MKKLLVLILAFLVLVPSAFASVGVLEDSAREGTATDLNFTTNLDVSNDGSTATVSVTASPSFTNVTATGFVYLPYYASQSLRPASGATRGAVISKAAANAQDCGAVGVPSNKAAVCVSDGVNWIALT